MRLWFFHWLIAAFAFLIQTSAFTQGIWVDKFGGAGTDLCNAMTIDSKGNAYLTGSFSGDSKFGNQVLSSQGGGDVFIAKITNAGKLEWVVTFGGAGDDFGNAIEINEAGQVAATGVFAGNIQYQNFNLQAGAESDAFIWVLDDKGNTLLVNNMQLGKSALPYCLAQNDKGEMVVGGLFSDKINGNVEAFGETDFFIAKINANGLIEWLKTGGGLGMDELKCLKMNAQGNVFFAGTFENQAVFENEELNGKAGSNAFFARLRTDGKLEWIKTLHSSKGVFLPQKAFLSKDETFFLAGNFSDTLFDKGLLAISNGQSDAFCLAMESNGNFKWISTGGSKNPDQSFGIIEKENHLIWYGLLAGPGKFGRKNVKISSDKGYFTAVLDAKSGKCIQTNSFARLEEVSDSEARLLENGDLFQAGYFTKTQEIGPRKIHSAGEEDVFLVKYHMELK